MISRRMWTGVLWGLMLVVAAWGVYVMVPRGWSGWQPHEAGVVADQEILERQDQGAREDWGAVSPYPVQPTLAPAGGVGKSDGLEPAWNPGEAGPPRMGSIYDEYRMERQRLRDQRLEVIQRMSEAPEVTHEQRWESQHMMLDLLALQAREIELEYLLKARGYEEAIVSLQGEFANVVLPGVLTERDAARIGELVARMAGVPIDRIAIVDGYEIP